MFSWFATIRCWFQIWNFSKLKLNTWVDDLTDGDTSFYKILVRTVVCQTEEGRRKNVTIKHIIQSNLRRCFTRENKQMPVAF